MKKLAPGIAAQLAEVARSLQLERTGHAPRDVTVVLSDDTLVVMMHDALTTAERVLAQTPEGAAQVQEFHRRLFDSSSQPMREAIERLTGRSVREAAAEVDPATGAIVHAFSSGSMVQMYLLASDGQVIRDESVDAANPAHRADDDGMPGASMRKDDSQLDAPKPS